MSRNDDAPLGTFEEQVMLAVIRRAHDAYGMAIHRELEDVTGRSVAVGAVYATLDRLEAKGLVQSTRTTADGTSRRIFSLTTAGARSLTESKAMREQLWQGVDLRILPT